MQNNDMIMIKMDVKLNDDDLGYCGESIIRAFPGTSVTFQFGIFIFGPGIALYFKRDEIGRFEMRIEEIE